jgi:hypothetical protein
MYRVAVNKLKCAKFRLPWPFVKNLCTTFQKKKKSDIQFSSLILGDRQTDVVYRLDILVCLLDPSIPYTTIIPSLPKLCIMDVHPLHCKRPRPLLRAGSLVAPEENNNKW